jgi:twitching motility two-component system response regulator PilH
LARKILLADDSVTAQNMGRKILLDAGYDVVTVNNGSAALKKIAEQKPDLIVLDVYMPGYSGLEVCQRVKDDEDTARIPVLLTVGKLEPFKPEEARKARADAYIVKPFEASELLVAITKLEDKVVPPPGPGKAGRNAKAANAASDQSFGDTESGWRKRLRFPTPATKVAVQKAEESASKPAAADLPKDITPEEIAAIAAAAAQVSEAPQDTAPAPQSTAPESASPGIAREWPIPESAPVSEPAATELSAAAEDLRPAELPPVTFASAMEAQAESNPAPVAEGSHVGMAGEIVSEPSTAVSAAAEVKSEPAEAPAVQHEAVPVAPEFAASTEPEVSAGPTQAEVDAALQTLSPSNGDGSSDKADTPANGSESQDKGSKLEDNPMAAVLAAIASTEMVAALPHGPRWVAESVALDAEEGTMILEREMEKAYAAFAAADAANASLAGASMISSATVSADSSAPVVAALEPAHEAILNAAQAPMADVSTPEAEQSSPAAESKSEEAPAPTEMPSTQGAVAHDTVTPATAAPETVAENIVQTEALPPTSQKEEVPTVAASETHPETVTVASAVASVPVAVEESHSQPESLTQPVVAEPEMAAGAAASAGASGVEWNSAAAAAYPAPQTSDKQDAGFSEGADQKVDSDLNAATAAAWANWRQIRDTVVSATSHATDAAAATFKDIRHEPPAKPEAGPASASDSAASQSASEASAIASIVDSVLSELKPRLVEEIARKMASDKKKE